ncbi:MAG TPA: GspH/FimT family pseudopilin [Luteimonas sp.]|nr:GspH/FimT family pseudopilin [Luteimonas sp.]
MHPNGRFNEITQCVLLTRLGRRSEKPPGFTLLQALIALAIVGVLVAIAQPIYAHADANVRIGEAKVEIYHSLLAAMNQAMVASTPVVMCSSSDSQRCGKDVDWTQGWIVFADKDMNRDRGPEEALIRRQPRLNEQMRVLSTLGRTRLVFQPNGGNAGSNVTFTICHARGRGRAASILLANNGRIRQAPATPEAKAICEGDY